VPTVNASSARRTSMPWLARLSARRSASVTSDPGVSTYSRVDDFSPSLIADRRYSRKSRRICSRFVAAV
jgi:hypothetical protein